MCLRLLLLAAALLVSVHAGSPLDVPTLTLRPTSRAPSTCNTRTCEASYVCKSVSTGMTCIRRKTTSKIVADTPGRCKKETISGYQWVPYNIVRRIKPAVQPRAPAPAPQVVKPVVPKPASAPAVKPKPKPVKKEPKLTKPKPKPIKKKPKSTKPKVRNVRGTFLVVAKGKVVRCKSLYIARKVLRRYKSGSRCIFQIKNGQVLSNPRKICGYPQTRKYGFNGRWRNAKDINHMRVLATEFYRRSIYGINRRRPTKKKRRSPRGIFLVVAGNRCVGRFTVLSHAKRRLAKYGRSRKIRCIFEVKNGRVLKSYSRIAGQRQSRGRRAGFNKYWRNTRDVRRMYGVATVYYKKYLRRMRLKNTRRRARFIVVAGHSVIGYFMKLSQAKRALKRFRRGAKKPSRCIFPIKKGRVLKSAKWVGGQNQYKGLPQFNKYWKNGKDLRRMRLIAKKYVKKHNLY